jgi:2-desacetyl-2-hydroxyethyl bacteriochlorophyllide A dehydrogenase
MSARAIVAVDCKKVEVRSVEPRPVKEWDIKIEVERTAISVGTESYVLSQAKRSANYIPGYGPVGRIVEAGHRAADIFAVGERVSCFAADAPASGERNDCGGHQSPAVMNVNPAERDLLGANSYCVKVPEALSSEHAAFGGIAAVASMGATMPAPEPGDTALVLGQGVIGVFAMQHLRLLGAEVAVADLRKQRLAVAEACGADHIIDATETDTAEALRAIWSDGADIVIDTTGSYRVIEAAVPAVRRRGRFVFLGWCKGADFALEKFHGQHVFSAYFPWTLEGPRVQHSWRMMLQGGINVEPVITHRMKVEEAPEAFRMIYEEPEEYVGIVLDWSRS